MKKSKLIISATENLEVTEEAMPSIRRSFLLNKVDLAKFYKANARRGKRQIVEVIQK